MRQETCHELLLSGGSEMTVQFYFEQIMSRTQKCTASGETLPPPTLTPREGRNPGKHVRSRLMLDTVVKGRKHFAR